MPPWTVAYQAPPSMGFSRQEYWSGVPFSSPRNLPDPRIEPGSPALQADPLLSEPPGNPSVVYKTEEKTFTTVSWTSLHKYLVCLCSYFRRLDVQKGNAMS